MHRLTLTARASPPRRDGALVKPKRRHNRLHGTPMGEQGHDEHHGLGRGAQPIEDRAFCSAEGLLTRVTDEPLLFPRMDTDIALASLASGRAVPIGAKCRCGVNPSMWPLLSSPFEHFLPLLSHILHIVLNERILIAAASEVAVHLA